MRMEFGGYRQSNGCCNIRPSIASPIAVNGDGLPCSRATYAWSSPRRGSAPGGLFFSTVRAVTCVVDCTALVVGPACRPATGQRDGDCRRHV